MPLAGMHVTLIVVQSATFSWPHRLAKNELCSSGVQEAQVLLGGCGGGGGGGGEGVACMSDRRPRGEPEPPVEPGPVPPCRVYSDDTYASKISVVT